LLQTREPMMSSPAFEKRWMMFVDGENITIRGQEILSLQKITPVASRAFRKNTFLWTPMPVAPNVLHPDWNNKPHALRPRAERCFYYTSIQGDADKVAMVQAELRHLNFTPRVFKKPISQRTKGVDIMLTKDLLSNAFLDNYDVALLLTGDADYVPVIEEIQRLGKSVVVLFYEDPSVRISSDLLNACDGFAGLDELLLSQWSYADHHLGDAMRDTSHPSPNSPTSTT
jgi:uncharacterized LabA/DUF88 family protein